MSVANTSTERILFGWDTQEIRELSSTDNIVIATVSGNNIMFDYNTTFVRQLSMSSRDFNSFATDQAITVDGRQKKNTFTWFTCGFVSSSVVDKWFRTYVYTTMIKINDTVPLWWGWVDRKIRLSGDKNRIFTILAIIRPQNTTRGWSMTTAVIIVIEFN